MFDKEAFSEILIKIYKTYSNQRDFANATEVNRAYLSQYMNKKLDNPPTPKILAKISKASHNITTYEELMTICGHIRENDFNSYLLGILGFSYDDMQNFNKSLDDLNMTKEEEDAFFTIISNFIKKSSNGTKNEEIPNIENELSKYDLSTRKKFSSALNVYIDYLDKIKGFSDIMGSRDKELNNKFFPVPVLGKIAAGQPILVQENIEGYLPVDPNIYGMATSDDLFYLRVSGESMNRKVKNGDYALIHKQDYAENGDIIVAIVNRRR